MKYVLLTIGTMLALISVAQAKDKPAPATESLQKSEQTKSMPNLGTIIVYRQWSFSGAGRPSWKFNVDNGADLIVRNGTYLRVDAPGDHVLDHKHMFLFGSDPQTVHIKAGETVYFQYVGAMSLLFEVADDQNQAARTVSKMRSVEEALALLSAIGYAPAAQLLWVGLLLFSKFSLNFLGDLWLLLNEFYCLPVSKYAG